MSDNTVVLQTGPTGVTFRIRSEGRIVILLMTSIIAVCLDNEKTLACVFAVSMACVLAARVSLRNIGLLICALAIVMWSTMLTQAIFYSAEPRTVMFTLVSHNARVLGGLTGDICLYREGFMYGAAQSLRFCTMIAAGVVFCRTTSAGEMLEGMTAIRIPYIMAFMTVTAVNFVPVVFDELQSVRLAMSMRGGKLLEANPFRTVGNIFRLMRPLIVNCFRRSGTIALAVQSRAFDPSASHSRLMEPRGFFEALIVSTAVFVTLGIVIIKVLFILYINDIFYSTHLRMLYDLCRQYI